MALVVLVSSNAFLVHASEVEALPAKLNIRKGLALEDTASYFAAAGMSEGIGSFPPAPLMPIPNARQVS